MVQARQSLNTFYFVLALIFTVGLTFATIELPYLIDHVLQGMLTTPDIDSHSSPANLLKTELFVAHFQLRTIGYVCFGLMIGAIGVGFATRKTGFAALGAFGFMLPVFAQFASVMMFLSGLGLLNVVWLPVLDISYELQQLGLIVKAPLHFLQWLFGLAGLNAYWPLVFVCIGGGLLIFLLSTFAWLVSRSHRRDVADFWLYRISRHPQYLGWILWSYGVFLLLEQQRYPKRSWGIGASLPFLLATLIIIGVAMMEELNMKSRFGSAYEDYRRRVPFLFPLPRIASRTLRLPQRLVLRHARPTRKREVIAVLGMYAGLLIGASMLIYGVETERIFARLSPERAEEQMIDLVSRIKRESTWRSRYHLAEELTSYGESSTRHLIELLEHPDSQVRRVGAYFLGRTTSKSAVPALIDALDDGDANVRADAIVALAEVRSEAAIEPLLDRMDDPDGWVRRSALNALAGMGEESIIEWASDWLRADGPYDRYATVEALGNLGSERAIPLIVEVLDDESENVRRAAVIALLQIGSPEALPYLRRSLDDQDWEVRIYADETIKRLRKNPLRG